jgi:hypothetical protein
MRVLLIELCDGLIAIRLDVQCAKSRCFNRLSLARMQLLCTATSGGKRPVLERTGVNDYLRSECAGAAHRKQVGCISSLSSSRRPRPETSRRATRYFRPHMRICIDWRVHGSAMRGRSTTLDTTSLVHESYLRFVTCRRLARGRPAGILRLRLTGHAVRHSQQRARTHRTEARRRVDAQSRCRRRSRQILRTRKTRLSGFMMRSSC